MTSGTPTLHMLCGKIAAGKSTLAAQLAKDKNAILIAEDEWLATLSGHEMKTARDYVRCASRLRVVMGPHVVSLLKAGSSVVLDFQANTVDSRAWLRGLFDEAHAVHQLHVLVPPDDVCLARLRARNARGTHSFTVTEDQFHEISKHFAEPSPNEGFDVVRYDY